MTAGPLAEARGVSRAFGSFTAVDAVDLVVRAGEVVGLLGANGAGKTTLVRVLLGLLAPSDGEVLLFGQPPSRRQRRRLGYVPQSLGLYDDLTPRENLRFIRRVFGVPDAAREAPRDPLAGVPDLPVGQLPLGLQREVAFAAALEHAPELLVLDEPTSGVAPLGSARLWETIRGATEAGAGALVTTHNLEEAEQCDRLVVMATGRVVASGTVSEIVGRHRSVEVRAANWVDAFDALQSAGIAATLLGDRLRVPGVAITRVRQALQATPAIAHEVAATLDERFLELAAAAGE